MKHTQNIKHRLTLALALIAALLINPGAATADVICNSSDLPPDCGEYQFQNNLTYLNPTPSILQIELSQLTLHTFTSPIVTPLPGGDELEEFFTLFDGMAAITPTSGAVINSPVSLSGPVQIITSGKTGNSTGTFSTEMISMSLSGSIGGFGIDLRESPTMASTGQTTITDLGGGLFQIDSFYDVFTELSVDGGSFTPAVSSSFALLTPEPSSALLLFSGLSAMAFRHRRILS